MSSFSEFEELILNNAFTVSVNTRVRVQMATLNTEEFDLAQCKDCTNLFEAVQQVKWDHLETTTHNVANYVSVVLAYLVYKLYPF